MTIIDQNTSLERCPALVLNADYRPLSYYPLSLWSWQDSVKSVFLDRVSIVNYYDKVVHSPSFNMKLPSVIALKSYIRPLSNPNFTRFNVEPPTMEQSNTIAAVESLADRVGAEQAQANLQAQFETMEQTGGFGDQTVAVAFIGYSPGFSDYTSQAQLEDREFYRDMGLPSPDVVDNNFSFYMMAGNADQKIAEMRR